MAVSTALLLTACSGSGDDAADGKASAKPTEKAAAERIELPVSAGDDLPAKTVDFLAAGVEVAAGEKAKVSLRQTSAGLVSARDASGNVVGAAVAASLPTFRQRPLEVTLRTTAVSRLLMTPSFASTNPLINMLVAGVAAEADGLEPLEEAIRQNAQDNPDYLGEPSAAETAALNALAGEVADDLTALATEAGLSVPTSTATPAIFQDRSEDATELAVPAAYTAVEPVANGWGSDECLRTDNGRGNFEPVEASGIDFCVKAARAERDKGYQVTVENSSGLWLLVMNDKAEFPANIANAVPPMRFVLPGISDIVQALLKSAGLAVAAKFEPIVCGGAELLGADCPEDLESFNFLDSLWDQLNPVQTGSTTFYVEDEDAATPMILLNAGLAGSSYPSPNDWLAASEATTWASRASLWTSIYSQIIDPAVALALNAEGSTEEKPEDKPFRDEVLSALLEMLAPDEGPVTGGHLDTYTQLRNLPGQVIGDGDPGPAINTVASVAFDVATNPTVVAAFVKYRYREWRAANLGTIAEKVVTFIGEKVAKLAVPLVQIAEAIDTGVGVVNMFAGVVVFLRGMWNSLAHTVVIPAVAASDPAGRLRYYDWSEPDLVFTGQVGSKGVQPHESPAVTFTRGSLPEGIAGVTIEGSISGTWNKRPVTAVGFTVHPTSTSCTFIQQLNGSCRYDTFHVNIYADAGEGKSPRPLAFQSWVDEPDSSRDYVVGGTRCMEGTHDRLVTRIEDGLLVEYRSFFKGAEVVPGCVFRTAFKPAGGGVKAPGGGPKIRPVAPVKGANQAPFRGTVPPGVRWAWN